MSDIKRCLILSLLAVFVLAGDASAQEPVLRRWDRDRLVYERARERSEARHRRIRDARAKGYRGRGVAGLYYSPSPNGFQLSWR